MRVAELRLKVQAELDVVLNLIVADLQERGMQARLIKNAMKVRAELTDLPFNPYTSHACLHEHIASLLDCLLADDGVKHGINVDRKVLKQQRESVLDTVDDLQIFR